MGSRTRQKQSCRRPHAPRGPAQAVVPRSPRSSVRPSAMRIELIDHQSDAQGIRFRSRSAKAKPRPNPCKRQCLHGYRRPDEEEVHWPAGLEHLSKEQAAAPRCPQPAACVDRAGITSADRLSPPDTNGWTRIDRVAGRPQNLQLGAPFSGARTKIGVSSRGRDSFRSAGGT